MKKTLLFFLLLLSGLNGMLRAQDNNRYMSMMFLNIEEGNAATNNYQFYADMIPAAKAIGCNSVYVTVRWDITKCPSFECLTNPNVASDWRHVDNVIAKATQEGIQKIALRIQLGVNNAFGNNRSGFIYGGEQYEMKDYYGNPYSQGYNNRMFSLAHQPTVDKAKNFVTEVTQRYKYLQDQGKLLFISISMTDTQEGQYPPFAIYDYSDHMRDAFSNWHLAQYGTTAQPPVNFDNEAGRRWYIFRHLKLKEFNDQISGAIKAVDSNIKFVLDFGSVYDGSNSKIGGTLGFPKLACNADGVKVNDAIQYNHRFAMDLLRTNLPNKWIMNEMFDEGSTSDKVKFLKESYEHGAKMVALVIGHPDAVSHFGSATQHPDIVSALQNPVPVISPTTPPVTYSLQSVLNSPYDYFSSSAYQDSTYFSPKNIVLNDDLLPGCSPGETCNFNVSPTVSDNTPDCGQNITLSANCTGGDCNAVSYVWSGSASGTTASISPNAPSANGTYTYTVTATKPGSGCSSKSGNVVVNVTNCTTESGGSCVVNKVRLKFRTDCCQDRLNGATIQGSNDGTNWTTFYTITENGNNSWQEFSISNTTPYQQVRFVASSSSYGELLEIEFYNGTTKLTGTVIGAGGTALPYSNAMDGNESTLWHGTATGSGNYVGLILTNCTTESGVSCVVNKVRLKFRTDCCQDRLNGATIQGSNDGTNWTTFYTINQNGNNSWQEFAISNNTSYQQVRFVASSSGYGELLEIEFYNGPTKLTGTVIGAGGTALPYSNAMDGNESTLWHGTATGSGNYVGLILTGCPTGGGVSCVVNKVRLKFRTDCCQDRLNGATIQGSNDGTNWTTFYTITENGNNSWQEFSISNTTPYQQVRFVASSSSYGELLEIEFYNGTTELTGTVIGAGGTALPYSNAMDGNESTLWHGTATGSGNYVGLVLTGCSGGGGESSFNNKEGEILLAESEKTFEVYPNPTDGKITVHCYLPKNQTAILQIVTLSGNVIINKAIKGLGTVQKNQLDLSLQPNGMYIISLQNDKATLSKKLILMK